MTFDSLATRFRCNVFDYDIYKHESPVAEWSKALGVKILTTGSQVQIPTEEIYFLC